MSATLRSIQAVPTTRPLGVEFGVFIAAAALLGVLAFGGLTTAKLQPAPQLAPAAGLVTANHDHGWSSAAGAQAPAIRVRGWTATPAKVATGSGSPFTSSDSHGTGGSNGTRFAQ